MSKTYFMNNGDFDVRAMMTMGVSAKDNDNAIGFFGTGFKYAIAIILRGGGSVKISTISGVYEFSKKSEEIRGKNFDLVMVNGESAGFTTHMGINWEPWMAYRELYCNAQDEGGEISDAINTNYDTIIEVNSTEIYSAHHGKGNYFISGKIVLSTDEVDVYEGGRPFFYCQGVAVKNAPDSALYSYNVKKRVDLSEERLARYEHQLLWPIRRAWQNKCQDKAMLRKVIRRGDHAEAKEIGFDADFGASDYFVSVVGELMATDYGACESARSVVKEINEKSGDWPEFEMTIVQQKLMDKAISVLKAIDIDVKMYPVKTVTGLGDGVLGRALDDVIYISELAFQMGTKQLASTLMEEWVHNKTGADDFDRTMQNWLFDKILSISENITGEPI